MKKLQLKFLTGETYMCACIYMLKSQSSNDSCYPEAVTCMCVRGYCVYKNVWAAVVGKRPAYVKEKENSHNIYVVSVMKNGVVFFNLPDASFHCSSKCFTYVSKNWHDPAFNICVLWNCACFDYSIITILAVTILVLGYRSLKYLNPHKSW